VTRELDFERPVLELERQIDELRRQAAGRDSLANIVDTGLDKKPRKKTKRKKKGPDFERQLSALEDRARSLRQEIFSKLSRWQIVQLARHPSRPYTLDYLSHAFSNFVELHGDRGFADDRSIVGGLARLDGRSVMVIGHQKGRSTKENLTRNFGMPRPEGYRKALRLMRVAERFGLPIVTLIDTPGAYPGIGAEERGQAQAIAEALEGMAALSVPVVTVVIGEGGSGGALAIGVANRVLMMEYGIYSVISPEGCASILFKDAAYAERAADALRLTAPDLVELGVVDDVITEPVGGGHRDVPLAAQRLGAAVSKQLVQLGRMKPAALIEDRYEKFRRLGALGVPVAPPSTLGKSTAPERSRRAERVAAEPVHPDSPAPEAMEEGALAAEGTLPVAPAEPHPTGVEDLVESDRNAPADASSSAPAGERDAVSSESAAGAKKSAVKRAGARKSAVKRAGARKSEAKKAAAKKSVATKVAATKVAATKSAAKKPAARESAVKKPGAKKSAATKSTARKSAAKKAGAKKSAVTKSTARKSAAKKAGAKKSATKKAAAKNSAPKKAAAKKSAPKKAAAKKSAPKKAAAKKSAPKKAAAKKSTRARRSTTSARGKRA
jgi:acetyl-CoA carboxylase carboxyl transferase subunit alpha